MLLAGIINRWPPPLMNCCKLFFKISEIFCSWFKIINCCEGIILKLIWSVEEFVSIKSSLVKIFDKNVDFFPIVSIDVFWGVSKVK